MKKQLFLGLATVSSLAAFAQLANKQLPHAKAVKVNLNKYNNSTYEPSFSTPKKQAGPVNTLGAPYKRIGGSTNNLGNILSESQCLQYKSEINTVGLVYRQNINKWTGIPNGNSGTIAYAWSSNNGGTWDSTIMAASTTFLNRYPAGAIYNPPANTNPSNAYAFATGPWHPGADWQGNYFSTKQLTAPGTNANANVTFVDNTSLLAGQTKQDFVRIAPQVTADGIAHVMGTLYADANGATAAAQGWRGVSINKGVFSAGTFTWSTDSIKPTFKLDGAGDRQAYLSGNMAWSESGQIGYVFFFGVDANAVAGTPANSFQPYVYKTIDAGITWNRFAPLFDFSSIPAVASRLFAVRGTTVSGLVKPFITPPEGASGTVDAAGNLHLFAQMNSSFSDNIDSLGYTYNTNYNQVWDYIADFKTTSTGWDAMVLDSLSCAGTTTATTNWTGSAPTFDARLQVSRTTDGKNIFFSWADTDSTLVAGDFPHASRFPDVYQIGYDVILNKLTCRKNMTAFKDGAEKQAYFFYASPIVAKPTSTTFQIPTSFTKSDDGNNNGDIDVSHYYLDDNMFSATEFTVTPNTVGCTITNPNGVGISEVSSSIKDLSFYPNPTSTNGTIAVTLNESAKVNIAVLNAVGQVVYSTSVLANAGSNNVDVNLSHLASGLYFYQVQVANKKAVTQKFVIEK